LHLTQRHDNVSRAGGANHAQENKPAKTHLQQRLKGVSGFSKFSGLKNRRRAGRNVKLADKTVTKFEWQRVRGRGMGSE